MNRQSVMFSVLTAAVAVAVVGAACSSAPAPVPEAPAPSPPAAIAAPVAAPSAPSARLPPPLEAGKEDEIQSELAQAQYLAWRDQRVATLAERGQIASHRVDRVDQCDECEHLLITERIVEGEACLQGPIALKVALPGNGEPSVEARSVGYDCCPGTSCSERAPIAWMLRYNQELAMQSLDGLRALIPPDGAIEVRAGWSDSHGESEVSERFTRAGLSDQVFDMVEPFNYLYWDIDCPPQFAPTGEAICRVQAGGFGSTYTWKKNAGQVFLLRIDEESR